MTNYDELGELTGEELDEMSTEEVREIYNTLDELSISEMGDYRAISIYVAAENRLPEGETSNQPDVGNSSNSGFFSLNESDIDEIESCLFTGLNNGWEHWSINGSELTDQSATVKAEGRVGNLTAYVDDERNWGFEYEHRLEAEKDEAVREGDIKKVEGLMDASTRYPKHEGWEYDGETLSAEYPNVRSFMKELFKIDRLDEDLMMMGLGRESPL